MGLSKLSIGLWPCKRKATEFPAPLFKAALPASVHAPLDRLAGERQHLGHSLTMSVPLQPKSTFGFELSSPGGCPGDWSHRRPTGMPG